LTPAPLTTAPLTTVGGAYSAGAAAWGNGPAVIYGRLAELLVAFCPVPVAGRLVLDLGAGTGLASRAARAAGGRLVAADLALGMLLQDRAHRPAAVVADALALPFAAGAFDVVLAAFALNHLDDPAAGVREAGRVGRALVASTYAADDDHPVKAAVEVALGDAGWDCPDWYPRLKASMAAWGTVAAATEAVERGGLRPLLVERHEVPFPELSPTDMVAWRLGLAHCAGFMTALDPAARTRLVERAVEELGPDPPPLVRRVIFLAAGRLED
jgi:SAM-dependent methyltransferase